jgi:hypothetical protein
MAHTSNSVCNVVITTFAAPSSRDAADAIEEKAASISLGDALSYCNG